MPKHDVSEHWTAQGKAPKEAWSVRDGMIACTGQPNGILRSRKTYRNYVLCAEWRFQVGRSQNPAATIGQTPDSSSMPAQS